MFLKNLFVPLGVVGISALSLAAPSQAASGTIKVTNNSPQSVEVSGYSASQSITPQSASSNIPRGATSVVANASGPDKKNLSIQFTATSGDGSYGCNYYINLSYQSSLNQYYSNYIAYPFTRAGGKYFPTCTAPSSGPWSAVSSLGGTFYIQ
jgi:hypothetical protein